MSEESTNHEESEDQNEAQSVPSELFEQQRQEFSNFREQLESQSRNMNAVIQHLQSMTPQQQQQAINSDEIDYDNMSTAEIIKHLKSDLISDLSSRQDKVLATERQKQSVLAEIQRDYPEAMDSSHKMHQQLLAENDALPTHLKDTPEGLQLASLRAAQKVGLVPKAKRQGSGDEYVMPGGKQSTAGKQKSSALDPKTLAFAQACGLDVQDKEVLKRLEGHNKRNYKKWG